MSRGRGQVETDLLNVLLDRELSDLPQVEKERGLRTSDLAGFVYCHELAHHMIDSNTAFEWDISRAQRASVSRALNRLARQGMVAKVSDYTAPRGEVLWKINPRIVIRPRS